MEKRITLRLPQQMYNSLEKEARQTGKTMLNVKIKDLAKVADSVTDQDLRDAKKDVMSIYGVKK